MGIKKWIKEEEKEGAEAKRKEESRIIRALKKQEVDFGRNS
ncbi:MAG: hypothetical protein NTX24_01385 [Candidatus Pacearchaeota archaeon]|nr:hypothetical protein [Candidatus Pacearchaeota archaeon]